MSPNNFFGTLTFLNPSLVYLGQRIWSLKKASDEVTYDSRKLNLASYVKPSVRLQIWDEI
jgi:hypothetical protein